MRNLAIFYILILSQAAVAAPAVGDWARYDGPYSGNGAVGTATMIYKIVADKGGGNFSIDQSIATPEGNGSGQDDGIIQSKEELQKYVTDCEKSGHVRDTLIVRGKSIDTCISNVTSGSSSIKVWKGAVPLGLVRMKGNASNTTFDFLLSDSFGAEYSN